MPQTGSYDALVVGAGPNGLSAGIAIAQTGRSVLVVEGRDTVGGGARSTALTLPGFLHDVCSAVHPLAVGSPFFSTLPLPDHGLDWVQPPAPLAHPLDDGTAVMMERSVEATADGLGCDAAAYSSLFGPLVRNWCKLAADILGPLRVPRHPLLTARFGLNGLPVPFGFATTEVIPLRPRHNGQDRRFLFFYLLHPDVRHHVAERMEGSTGRQRVPTEVLLDLPYPDLPPGDQVAVAESLESLLRLKSVEEQSITTTQALKRAAMHTLFTRGLRDEAQKETEIGPVPEAWEVSLLRDCTEKPDYGYTASANSEPIGPRLLRITDIQEGHVDWNLVPYCNAGDDVIMSKGLKEDDIVVARIGATTGKSFFIRECPEAIHASYLIRIRVHQDKIVPAYLYYYMQTDPYWQHIDHHKGGRLKGGVNIPVLASLPLPVTHLSEQREIVAILEAIDRKIDLHRRKRAVLEELFKALLHKLMTGEIRVGDWDSVMLYNNTAGVTEAVEPVGSRV